MEHSREYKRRVRKRIVRRRIRFAVVCVALAVTIVLSVFACKALNGMPSVREDEPIIEQQQPLEPYVISTATVGSSGDILIHSPILSNAKTTNGGYDFNNILTQISSYFSAYDYMVANLEVPCGGTTSGEYRGYPTFNCPDSILDAFKTAGLDMFLTANNHTYDTGYSGLLRTQSVIKERNIDYTGTRESADGAKYLVKDINGIKIGFACYTYETKAAVSGRKALNGILMSAEAGPLVNSFNYDKLDEFYSEVEKSYTAMINEGADAVIFYMHWGNEYQRTLTKQQTAMAQKLADIGVDVIVGGHPHTVQPFDTLTGVNGNQTVCIYSVGNLVSNQRKALMDSDGHSGHTEDGMIFEVKFEKWSTGETKIAEVDILPLWVNLKTVGSKRVYEIAPLDLSVDDWSTLGLSGSALNEAKASYNRTMKLVGEPLNEYRASLGLDKVKTIIE